MLFFDEDSDARFFRVEAGTMTTDKLDPLVDLLAGSDVKVFTIGVNAKRTNFLSKKGESYLEGFDMAKGFMQPWMEGQKDAWAYRRAANLQVLFNAGIDSNEYLLKRARTAGMAPWITIRMNDDHSTWIPRNPIHSNFWMDHPELRLHSWAPAAGFDYAFPQIRKYFSDIVDEVMDTYDADGFVIDWMRHLPMFCDGEGEKNADKLTEMMAHFREYANTLAKRRGHPIQIIARVPTSLKWAQFYGLNGVEWAKCGLVDRLVLSPRYIRFCDVDLAPWRQAIGNEDFPLTLCLEHAYQPYPGYPAGYDQGIWKKEPMDAGCIPYLRGALRTLWAHKPDGVYLFNFMSLRNNPDFASIFQEGGSLEKLRGKECAFDITYDDVQMSEQDYLDGWRAGDTDSFFSQWRAKEKAAGTYPFQLPLDVAPGQTSSLRFFTGDVQELTHATLRLEGVPQDATVTLNGVPAICSGESDGTDGFFWNVSAYVPSIEEAQCVTFQAKAEGFSVLRAALILK